MRISDIDLAATDLDWFAVDQLGRLGHFATGGIGWVPESIRDSIEENTLVGNYFKYRAQDVSDFELLYENIPDYIKSDKLDRYVSSFYGMAKKGIFSFDVSTRDLNKRDFYFLIAKPRKNIEITDLPEDILKVISKTSLKIDFSSITKINKLQV